LLYELQQFTLLFEREMGDLGEIRSEVGKMKTPAIAGGVPVMFDSRVGLRTNYNLPKVDIAVN